MDARNSAGRASAPPARTTAPTGTPVPEIDGMAPWEMPGRADRPSGLPEPQPAPWEQSAQAAPPWERPATPQATPDSDTASAPWADESPMPPRPGRGDAPRFADEPLYAGEPAGIEVPPWDEPVPFAFDLPPADAFDPYDALAPLADDVRPRSPRPLAARMAASSASTRMTAPPMSRPAHHEEGPARSHEETRRSVFGDIFAPPPTPTPSQADADESAAQQPSADDDAGADEQPGQDAAPTAEAEAISAQAEPGEAGPPNPVEWPPVPTHFASAHQPTSLSSRHQQPDPLAWPPIPGDLLRVPDLETHVSGAQPSVWEQPAGEDPSGAEAPQRQTSGADSPSQTPVADRQFEGTPQAAAAGPYSLEAFTVEEVVVEASVVSAMAPEPAAVAEPEPATPQPATPEPATAGPAPAQPGEDDTDFELPNLFDREPYGDGRGFETAYQAPELDFAPPPAPQFAEPEPQPAREAEPEPVLAEAPASQPWAITQPAEPTHPSADVDDWAIAEPVSEGESDTPWAISDPLVEADPVAPAQSSRQAAEDQRGAVFARYASGGAATEQPMSVAYEVAERPAGIAPAGHGRGSDDSEDLWFLSGEPRQYGAGSAGEQAVDAEPSSVQTAILTVLVALGVIALVIVFLALFTSIF
jgi:hypothetical protein